MNPSMIYNLYLEIYSCDMRLKIKGAIFEIWGFHCGEDDDVLLGFGAV
jgi:hypothetical protein